jgi:hypothetical protein
MKVTFERFLSFLANGRNYCSTEQKSKLTYAIEKVIKLNKKAIDTYNETLEDARIDNAATDEKGTLLMDGNQYRYTKDGAKSLNKAIRDLKNSEVEIEFYHAAELPKDLNEDLAEALGGFVIKPNEKKKV